MKTNVLVRGDRRRETGEVYHGGLLRLLETVEVDPAPETCRTCGEHFGRLLGDYACGNCRNEAARAAGGE